MILTTILGIGIAAGAYMGMTFFRARKDNRGFNNSESIEESNIVFQKSISWANQRFQ